MNAPWSGRFSRHGIVAVASVSDAGTSGGGPPLTSSADETAPVTPFPPGALRELWDFADPEASADRFHQEAQAARSPLHRDELLTQHARALGLAGRPGRAVVVLDGITSSHAVVRVRVLLERGRLLRSGDDEAAAVPLFRAASDLASEHGVAHLAVDALHMLALADTGHEEQWTYRGLAVARGSRDPETRRWLIALHNNLAWHLHDEERFADALDHFQRALAAARQFGRPDEEGIARWAVARCLRSMGRTRQALEMQRELVAVRPDDPYVLEEIAILQELQELGREDTPPAQDET